MNVSRPSPTIAQMLGQPSRDDDPYLVIPAVRRAQAKPGGDVMYEQPLPTEAFLGPPTTVNVPKSDSLIYEDALPPAALVTEDVYEQALPPGDMCPRNVKQTPPPPYLKPPANSKQASKHTVVDMDDDFLYDNQKDVGQIV